MKRSTRFALGSVLSIHVLALFVIVSLTWSASGYAQFTFSLGPDASTLQYVNAAGTTLPEETIDDLAAIAQTHQQAIVIDGAGSGMPGLIVLDPARMISWLPSKTGPLVPSDRPHVYLFDDTYTAKTWSETGDCALLPDGAIVLGTIERPAGAEMLEYAWTPAHGCPLPPGLLVMSSSETELRQKVSSLYSDAFDGAIVRPEQSNFARIVTNPLCVISYASLALGVTLLGLSWYGVESHRNTHTIALLAIGATLPTLCKKELVRFALQALLPGIALMALSRFASLFGVMPSSTNYPLALGISTGVATFLLLATRLTATTAAFLTQRRRMNNA